LHCGPDRSSLVCGDTIEVSVTHDEPELDDEALSIVAEPSFAPASSRYFCTHTITVTHAELKSIDSPRCPG